MTAPSEKVVMVGAGNVAWHLAPALEKAGFTMAAVVSQKLAHAAALCQKLASNPQPLSSLPIFPTLPPAKWVILALPDDQIAAVAAQLKLSKTTSLLHTSGATPLVALANAGVPAGVLYPLQTFSKEKTVHFQQIPLLIEASSAEVFLKLQQMANSLSATVYPADSAQRKKVHLAAVFACNFTNHLYGIAHQLLQKEELPLNLLAPLMHETLEKALKMPPKLAQTGPAIRNDKATLQTHQQLLQDQPYWQHLYQLLSEGIQKSV